MSIERDDDIKAISANGTPPTKDELTAFKALLDRKPVAPHSPAINARTYILTENTPMPSKSKN